MNFLSKLFFLFLFLGLSDCNRDNLRLVNKNEKSKVILGSESSKGCTERSFSQWSILFGAVPLNSITTEQLFENTNAAYKIYQRWTLVDYLISLPLVYITTITRNSLIVETCSGEGAKVATDEEIDRIVKDKLAEKEKESIQRIDEYFQSPEFKDNRRLLNLITFNDGRTIEAEVTDIGRDKDYIEVKVKQEVTTIVTKQYKKVDMQIKPKK